MSSQLSTFLGRLETFEGYWDEAAATARQLAALGHVFDRPPLAYLDEGSYCIACGLFVPKAVSVLALEGALRSKDFIVNKPFKFHHSGCERLQIRMPYDTNNWDSRLDEDFEMSRRHRDPYRPSDQTDGVEGALGQPENHKSHLMALPVELRSMIYEFLLPFRPTTMWIGSRRGPSMEVYASRADRWTEKQYISSMKCGIDLDAQDWRQLTQMLRCSLLTSCSQMHDEVLDLLYRDTTIITTNTSTLYLFLRQIGARGRQALQRIDAKCGYREDAITYALLATCSNMRHIDLELEGNGSIRQGPLWLIDGMSSIMALKDLNVRLWRHSRRFGQIDFEEIETDLVRARKQISSMSHRS